MNQRPPLGLTLTNISKSFDSRNGRVTALAGLNAHVAPGEFLCVVGPSGCGKSTLLKIVAGLVQPTTGRLTFDADDERPRCALVFQEHSLFPWLTLLDNVAFGLEALGVPRPAREAQAQALLDQFGLDAFKHHFPHELSGGMRQRGAIARAILTTPHVLLMDEPFSALDAQSKLLLQEELLRLWQRDRPTVIYVTHDIEEAVLLGDRVLVMSGRPGRIRESLTVPLPRPRNLQDGDHPATRDIRWHIWKTIEAEVRQSLHLAP